MRRRSAARSSCCAPSPGSAPRGTRVERARTDNGNGYIPGVLRRTLEQLGIQHRRTGRYTPRTNVVCPERDGTRVEHCGGCQTQEIEVRDTGWAGAWCTPCWIEERERRQDAEEWNMSLKRIGTPVEGAADDGHDFPF